MNEIHLFIVDFSRNLTIYLVENLRDIIVNIQLISWFKLSVILDVNPIVEIN